MSTNGESEQPAVGPFEINAVTCGDCTELIPLLPNASVDVVVTSPPYWGQRVSSGMGAESDPREYVNALANVFAALAPKMKSTGLIWLNIGDAYNTPVNWRLEDRSYSTLGEKQSGLAADNSAYVKPRAKRKAFVERETGWLTYGNLLALPYRLIIELSERGYLFRGEVIWRKSNPMPEGRCRRPHRQHEPIYLLSPSESHSFRTAPPVGSVWEFANERIEGKAHFSRFPTELPRRCIDAYGIAGPEVLVLDPFSGSGTTGLAARSLGCSYVGFEIDPEQVEASNERLSATSRSQLELV